MVRRRRESYRSKVISSTEQQILRVQRSTKTTIRLMSPVHDRLRLSFSWYSKWHAWPFASITHWSLLFVFSLSILFVVYFSFGGGASGTIAAPVTVVTGMPTIMGRNSVAVVGTITYSQEGDVKERGFEYGTSTSGGSWSKEIGLFGNGRYSATITDLAAATTYYARAYAKADGIDRFGEWVSFTTSSGEMSSPSFQITSSVVSFAGGRSLSENYTIEDVGDSIASGAQNSTNFGLSSGYWPTVHTYKIVISAGDRVTMGKIVGHGQSPLDTNHAAITVGTDNPDGYNLFWRSVSEFMVSNKGDRVDQYQPNTDLTAENWSISSGSSAWGAHLGSQSTTVDKAFWGEKDTYLEGKWLNVPLWDYQIASRNNRTATAGDREILYFGAEVGKDKIQPSGSYNATVVVTALTID